MLPLESHRLSGDCVLLLRSRNRQAKANELPAYAFRRFQSTGEEERGHAFMTDFGDIDEPFYDQRINRLEHFAVKVRRNPANYEL